LGPRNFVFSCSASCGPRSASCGPRSASCRPRSASCGPRSASCRPRFYFFSSLVISERMV
ncbi:hypothetical protein T03_1699, partial [Trichinella britovi]